MKKRVLNSFSIILLLSIIVFIISCANEDDPEFLDAFLFKNQEKGTAMIYILNDITDTVEIYVDDEYQGELSAKLEGTPSLNNYSENCIRRELTPGKHYVEVKGNNIIPVKKEIDISTNTFLAVPFTVVQNINNLPVLSTIEITNITNNSATSGGNITNNGDLTVIARGVCWSKSQNPTITDSHSTDGTGIGSFTSNLTNLSGNTIYYARAYATNSAGTSYGNELSFTTSSGINTPTITTTEVSSITDNSAISGGNITSDGGLTVTTRGICWSVSQNPTIAGSHSTDGTGTGSFTSNLTTLSENSTYYVKAYATNSAGTSYGKELSFTTSSNINTPTITTTEVSSITDNSAVSGGEITFDGGSVVNARGICWSTTQNPTITDSHTIDGTGTGSFTSSIINLSANTSYYVRAYATNTAGTSYGNEISFITTATIALPSVSTDGISNISQTMAKSGGNISNDGGASVTERGVCWNTNRNPTIANNHTNDGSGIYAFESYLIGLTPGTTYYVRAYATNSLGTAYGDELSFSSSIREAGTVSDKDGNIYNTVKIGEQWWMSENLKVTHYQNGSAISLITDNTVWGNLADNNSDDAFCYYNNNATSEYGALYTWAAAMGDNASSSSSNPSGIQGACPAAWHLPSDAEWTELEDFVSDDGYSGTEGAALKAISGWNSSSGNGTDNYGFTILPGGVRDDGNGTFNNVTYTGIFWSTTEIYGTNAYTRNFLYSNVFRDNFYKSYGHSVRCVKD